MLVRYISQEVETYATVLRLHIAYHGVVNRDIQVMKDKLSEWQMPNDPIMESLQADVDFLTARIQALQNHPSAYESLRAAKQELQVKKQAIANRSRFLEHS